MSLWETIKQGAQFFGSFATGGPMQEMYQKAFGEIVPETNAYLDQARQQVHQVEAARGELAQISGSRVTRSDALLDVGLPGLKFFDIFLPIYNDWTKAGLDLQKDVYDQYDRLRGIDFSAFRLDTDSLGLAHAALADGYARVDSGFKSLMPVWEGEAAAAASAYISNFLNVAQEFQSSVEAMSGSVGHHVSAMESIVRTRAEAALDLYSINCSGYGPNTLETLIQAARNNSGLPLRDTLGSFLDSVGGIAADAAGALPGVGKLAAPVVETLNGLSDKAEDVLDNEFVPAFEGKLKKFNDHVCHATETDLKDLWNAFRASTNETLKSKPFAGVPPLVSGT